MPDLVLSSVEAVRLLKWEEVLTRGWAPCLTAQGLIDSWCRECQDGLRVFGAEPWSITLRAPGWASVQPELYSSLVGSVARYSSREVFDGSEAPLS